MDNHEVTHLIGALDTLSIRRPKRHSKTPKSRRPKTASYNGGVSLQGATQQTARPLEVLHIWIHGACKGNGKPTAKGAYGAYFGATSSHNSFGLVPATERQASHAAVLYAVKAALDKVQDILTNGLKEICIITHSSYAKQCLERWVQKWEKNGYKDVRAKEVVNRSLVQSIRRSIRTIQSIQHVKVRLETVAKALNQDAIDLANEAFPKKTAAKRKQRLTVERATHQMEPHLEELALRYWVHVAYLDPIAQHLCDRLGIQMTDGSLESFTGIAATVRRLVITGEDRPLNYRHLFGEHWRSLVEHEWDETRIRVLNQARRTAYGRVVNAAIDPGAPYQKIRKLCSLERLKLGPRLRQYKNHAVKNLSNV